MQGTDKLRKLMQVNKIVGVWPKHPHWSKNIPQQGSMPDLVQLRKFGLLLLGARLPGWVLLLFGEPLLLPSITPFLLVLVACNLPRPYS